VPAIGALGRRPATACVILLRDISRSHYHDMASGRFMPLSRGMQAMQPTLGLCGK
jgi:hypothetical protein